MIEGRAEIEKAMDEILQKRYNGQASMSYSLSKSLGDNAIGLTAYYLSSPFNLLLYFTDNIPLFVSIAKIGRASCRERV